MDTVTRVYDLMLQPGKGQLLKPKRTWCSVPTGTFTQNTSGPALYAIRRVLHLDPNREPRQLPTQF
jgi:hypothetical protein